MAKLIAISEEAYTRLRRLKGKDRSFTKVILELVGEKSGDLGDLFGALNVSTERLNRIKREIKKERENMFSGR